LQEEKEEKQTTPCGRKLSLPRRVIFILLPAVILALLAEIILRILGLGSPQIDPTVYKNVAGDFTPRQDIIQESPAVGISYHITINEQGFRGAGRVRPGRPCRVLCLGDSSMMGHNIDEGYTAPDLLRGWFEDDFPGVFDVINAASIGYTIDDEFAYMKEKGAALKPTLVVLEIFYNDVTEKKWRSEAGWQSQREFRKTAFPYTPLRSILLKSSLFQALRTGIIKILIKTGRYFPANRTDMMDMAMFPSRHPKAWKEYDFVLLQFIHFLKEKDIPLLVVITPHQYQVHRWGYPLMDYFGVREYQEHFLKILGDEQVSAIDLMPVYLAEMKKVPSLYMTGGLYDEHTDVAGQFIKAREIYAESMRLLTERGFFSFYKNFGGCEISGEAHTGREWVSRHDAPSIVLNAGSSVTYHHIQLGVRPVLRFTPVVPWYSEKKLYPLEVDLVDEATSEAEKIFSVAIDYNGRSKMVRLREKLARYAGKTVSIQWKVEGQAETGHTPAPMLCLKAPLLINTDEIEARIRR